MATLASVIINKASNVLNDAGAVRWTSAELLDWLNDGQREITMLVPAANSKVANLALVAGTKQTLPSDGIALLNVNRNMGVGGATPAEAPRRTSMDLMTTHRPSWHADSSTLVVKNWIYDPKLPDVFWVWPPMTSATTVELEYSFVPALVAAVGNAISLDDTYQNPLLDYILYRAFEKDTEIASMQARAQTHFAAFRASLGATDGANKEGA